MDNKIVKIRIWEEEKNDEEEGSCGEINSLIRR